MGWLPGLALLGQPCDSYQPRCYYATAACRAVGRARYLAVHRLSLRQAPPRLPCLLHLQDLLEPELCLSCCGYRVLVCTWQYQLPVQPALARARTHMGKEAVTYLCLSLAFPLMSLSSAPSACIAPSFPRPARSLQQNVRSAPPSPSPSPILVERLLIIPLLQKERQTSPAAT